MVWMYLAGQVVCAAASVVVFRGAAAPENASLRALWRDVWAPLLLVLPFFGFVPAALPDVGGVGWAPLGGPIIVAWMGVAAALFVTPARDGTADTQPGDVVFWALAGAILLLLGAAHDLHIWVGQCALALGAILLWRNTPAASSDQDSDPTAAQPGNTALGVAVLFSLAHAVFVWLVLSTAMDETRASQGLMVIIVSASMVIAIMGALALVLAMAGQFNDRELVRLGGWAGTYGVLLAIGLFSLIGLLPQSLAPMTGGAIDRPQLHVAYGFGRFALEATLLLVLAVWSLVPASGGAATLQRPGARRALAATIGAGLALLVMWRVIGAVSAFV